MPCALAATLLLPALVVVSETLVVVGVTCDATTIFSVETFGDEKMILWDPVVDGDDGTTISSVVLASWVVFFYAMKIADVPQLVLLSLGLVVVVVSLRY